MPNIGMFIAWPIIIGLTIWVFVRVTKKYKLPYAILITVGALVVSALLFANLIAFLYDADGGIFGNLIFIVIPWFVF